LRKLFIKQRYIEIVGDMITWRIDLTLWNVFCIGEFTRENVADWLADNTVNHSAIKEDFPVDFHAVCGGQDIPWATKEGRDCYERMRGIPNKEALAHCLHEDRMRTLTGWMVITGYVSLAIIIVKFIWP
jgi:hypothetical protein